MNKNNILTTIQITLRAGVLYLCIDELIHEIRKKKFMNEHGIVSITKKSSIDGSDTNKK